MMRKKHKKTITKIFFQLKIKGIIKDIKQFDCFQLLKKNLKQLTLLSSMYGGGDRCGAVSWYWCSGVERTL